MTNKKLKDDIEINIDDCIEILSKGKWKILFSVVISVVLMFSYHATEKNFFTATTDIKKISVAKENQYVGFNNQFSIQDDEFKLIDQNDELQNDGLFVNYKNTERFFTEITKETLFKNFIEALNEKILFEDAMHKFRLLDSSEFSDVRLYEEAVSKLASTIEILTNQKKSIDLSKISNSRLKNLEARKTNDHLYSIKIKFKHHDREKWKKILHYVNDEANKIIKKDLQFKFNKLMSVREKNKKARLEDFATSINNLLIDYEREASDKVAYLREQSSIAKELNIKTNTLEIVKFGNDKTSSQMLSNVRLDTPLYFRGYEAIDKEIDLIMSRKDKKAFIPGLLPLQKKRRNLKQDKTLQRIRALYEETPLSDGDSSFSAASIKILSTRFEYKDKKIEIIGAVIFGLIFGVLLQFIASKPLNKKKFRKKLI